MWTYYTVITFETAIKMTPYCQGWPTLCWFFLKAYGMLKYLILDRDRMFWMLCAFFILSVMLINWFIGFKQKKELRKELLVKQEFIQRRYEESMDELLSIQLMEKQSEQFDCLTNKHILMETSSELQRCPTKSMGAASIITLKESLTEQSEDLPSEQLPKKTSTDARGQEALTKQRKPFEEVPGEQTKLNGRNRLRVTFKEDLAEPCKRLTNENLIAENCSEIPDALAKSVGSGPHVTFREASTDSSSLRSFNSVSQSTQTGKLKSCLKRNNPHSVEYNSGPKNYPKWRI
ncbi:uncharacterized protein Dvir_GJ13942 [Drosophila virilis]|uniref:Uncharacterized protein n=1 Tax=Drosophila virilis TaxID=7244 RepID=B4LIF0_DROVI|nr:uncharacterized protein LOC6624664 [Drosophila virilis]EDW70737.2 uncharacterized protein Dvir_GJ13942 [Drosophila virilis]